MKIYNEDTDGNFKLILFCTFTGKMNIITIGDLHGSSVWKEITPKDWDQLIFSGDYVDSFEFKDGQIIENLEEVIQLKKEYPQKVILLLGNHDLGYLFKDKPGHGCSGFRAGMAKALFNLFSSNHDLFLCAWQVDNYLWTHAGIVGRWYKNFVEGEIVPSDINLAGTINKLFDAYYLPLFHVSNIRGGRNKDGGIFWADSMETIQDPLPGYHQIAGHTKTGNGIITYSSEDNLTSVTYTDCLETTTEFYKLKI
jgi:Calcineurin-like phosphoesterase